MRAHRLWETVPQILSFNLRVWNISMTEIVILGGTCGTGPGTYDLGLFHLPDGTVRGVEDLVDLISPQESGATPATRRGGIARGLRDALAASGPLPRPSAWPLRSSTPGSTCSGARRGPA